jgi:small-conductance mechanosensitive channel
VGRRHGNCPSLDAAIPLDPTVKAVMRPIAVLSGIVRRGRRTPCGSWMRRSLPCCVALFMALLAPAPLTQSADNADESLEAAQRALEEIEQRLQQPEVPDEELTAMRQRLLVVQQQAVAIAAEQTPRLESAQARLTELGPAPPEGEAPDIARQRQSLQGEVSQLDSTVKLARLLGVTGEQLADRVAARARTRFRAQLFARADPLPSGAYFRDLAAALPADLARLRRQVADLVSTLGGRPAPVWLGAALLVLASIGLRRWLLWRLGRLVTERAPHGRVRRSLLACARSLLAMLVPGAVACMLLVLARPAGSSWDALFDNAVGMALFSAYVAGLGNALLLPERPSWRLPALPDEVALDLRHYPAVLALAIFASWFAQQLAVLAQAGLATTIAIAAAASLVLGAIIGRLVWYRHARRLRPWWLAVAVALARLLLGASLVLLVIGYVALGAFIVGQIAWTAVLIATVFLLWALTEDLAGAWATSNFAPELTPTIATHRGASRREQLAVLTSAALHLIMLVALCLLLLVPFGESPGELLRQGERLGEGIKVGQIQLRPGAVVQALLVFVLALAALRVLRRWLAGRFLPTTSLDAGMRDSLVRLLGFVGTVLAMALGLSAVGLELDKVTWIASALTVGVGFGLQSIVSNFVSGLILLAERRVKVGDWVALSGIEGDIRRINVRATEIQMGDRSTVIVPNSEFITKVVRNVTRSKDTQGLVQIKLPLPLDTDAERVRSILLRAFEEQSNVLHDPPPTVLLDGVEGDKLIFSATAFVASPRLAAATRSELLFRVLGELRRQSSG